MIDVPTYCVQANETSMFVYRYNSEGVPKADTCNSTHLYHIHSPAGAIFLMKV